MSTPLPGSPWCRAVFADREDAEEVASRLRAGGFAATVGREPFAGEDDDEDHAHAVLTDAPEAMLELLADEHEGWVDHDAGQGLGGASARPAPVELPVAPRTRHRPT